MSLSRTPGRTTPGRRRNANKENVYFEPGKQGRKTGLILADSGVRDEHGFEPVSGIFETPARNDSPERRPLGSKTRESTEDIYPVAATRSLTFTGVTAEPTLGSTRRTPRLPPPRSQTPRKSHIAGSPIRHSAIKPGSASKRAYEQHVTPTQNFSSTYDESTVVTSVERDAADRTVVRTAERSVRRSGAPTRRSMFEGTASSPLVARRAGRASSPAAGAIDELSQVLDTTDPPTTTGVELQPHPETDEDATAQYERDDYPPQDEASLPNLEQDSLHSGMQLQSPSMQASADSNANVKRKRGARRSDMSTVAPADESQLSVSAPADESQISVSAPADESHISEPRSSAKRRRITMDASEIEVGLSPSQRSARPSSTTASPYVAPPNDEVDDEPSIANSEDQGADQHDEDDEDDNGPIEEPPASAPRTGRKRKSIVPKRRVPKPPASAKNPAASRRAQPGDDSDNDEQPGTTIMGRMRMRSATPFEDSGVKVTRSGRASIKPLAYWKNETFVYKHGDVEGVIRAEELPAVKRPRPAKKRRNLGRIGEEDEEDDDEHEDLLPEAWEDEVGVISGHVRAWDPEVGGGGLEEHVEDVAFAAQAITTHEVAGGSLRYAKVLTSPFFGAGLVELPPGGAKRVKNSRKMHMAFFVHAGKVTVDVAGLTFGVTAGGMWQVPRGNNYAIENESALFPAKVWFAQACEADAVEGA